MYCIKCGVKLADTETICPLCKTRVYHPDIIREQGVKLYPEKQYPKKAKRSLWLQGLITGTFLLPIIITLLCDLQISGGITWSGYVFGAVILAYICVVLPTWFAKPNPVIFVPCGFAAAILYLLYINLATRGHWFLSFAFPVSGGIAIIVTAVVTLLRYIKKGRLYIMGGAAMLLGVFMFPVELLANLTFGITRFIGWSFYPLAALAIIGGLLIFFGICRPARQTMERKFFI